MEEETKQMLTLAGGALAIIAVVAGCMSYETQSDNAAVVEMVKGGADPMRAQCAVSPSVTTCQALAAK